MNSITCLENRESEKTVTAAHQAPEIRFERVLSIRRQLGEGRYCVVEKLDVVADRILEELLKS